jgi:Arc/MetJ family transcription regulator
MGRTNIELDDWLVEQAMDLTGARCKREVVDIALRRLVDKGGLYRSIRNLERLDTALREAETLSLPIKSQL